MRNTASFPAGDKQLLKQKLIHWGGNFSACICFDRNAYPFAGNDFEFVAGIGAATSANTDHGTFASLRSFTRQTNDWIFGYFSYDLKNEIEPEIFSHSDHRFDGIGFAPSFFFTPEILIAIEKDKLVIRSAGDPEKIFRSVLQTITSKHRNHSGLIRSRTDINSYLKTVNQLKEHIASGDLYEVNFCQEFFTEDYATDPCALFCLLNEISPAPYSCFVKHRNRFLLCASPERFLQKKGNRLFSQPMKGTLARSADPLKDLLLKNQLLNDPKERAENVMIVDLVRNDLARSAVAGSVKVDELFGVYTFPRVHQMVSAVSATLREDVHYADAIRHAFPMGSMTGAPKVMAMQLIDEFEPVKRGLFSGSVGFITPGGDFDFNVVIRSILYNADDRYLSFQAGSAITYEADPEKEFEECMLKAENMRRAIEAH